tara:strand:+ start:804 stop:1202 length:399 start_codon:yes stop_codon:yes gene_type:complete
MQYLKDSECVFCKDIDNRVVEENNSAFAIYDVFPVTKHHVLILPKKHIRTYFDLKPSELYDCNRLIHLMRKEIIKKDNSVTGFNIGINDGKEAGQTVFHCHIHLIPRRDGDVKDPTGGIRGIVPSKQNYYYD